MQNTDQRDRVSWARDIRRRQADHRMAEQLRERGWTFTPPDDEVEAYLRQRTLSRGTDAVENGEPPA